MMKKLLDAVKGRRADESTAMPAQSDVLGSPDSLTRAVTQLAAARSRESHAFFGVPQAEKERSGASIGVSSSIQRVVVGLVLPSVIDATASPPLRPIRHRIAGLVVAWIAFEVLAKVVEAEGAEIDRVGEDVYLAIAVAMYSNLLSGDDVVNTAKSAAAAFQQVTASTDSNVVSLIERLGGVVIAHVQASQDAKMRAELGPAFDAKHLTGLFVEALAEGL